ncbi:unnamed protein product [Polarella glacialis]|uniref:RING-type E3 ubiquitin transferase n=1 Tax=Polarella glacialis TaxID=89957 RepID=A0A813IJN9_POLGL|nr:unnamed protein product [Polarella glacialis]
MPKRQREQGDDDDDEEIPLTESISRDEELLKLLECPVCLDGPMLPPVRQCENGHLLCSACREKPECLTYPTCRATPLRSRNLALERLAENSGIKVPCPHKVSGCPTVLPYGAVTAHVRNCDFQPIACSWPRCGEVLPMSEECILSHLSERHSFRMSTDCMASFGVVHYFRPLSLQSLVHSERELPGTVYSAHGSTFLLRMVTDSERYHCFVQLVGPQPRTVRFQCRLTYEVGARCHQWTGPPSSVATPIQQVMDMGDCLSVARNILLECSQGEAQARALAIRLEVRLQGELPPFRYGDCASKRHCSLKRVKRAIQEHAIGDQAEYFSVVARLARVGSRSGKLVYRACGGEQEVDGRSAICGAPLCGSSGSGLVGDTTEAAGASGECLVCGSTTKGVPRLMMPCLFTDDEDSLGVQVFHDAAEQLLGLTAEEVEVLQQGSQESFDARLQQQCSSEAWQLTLRTFMLKKQGQSVPAAACIDAFPVACQGHAWQLLKDVKQALATSS